MPTYEELGFGQQAPRSPAIAPASVFGQVMGLVAFTMAFAALGAYVARDLTGGTGFLFFIVAIGCIFGLNGAASRGREQLAIGLLFGHGPAARHVRGADPQLLREYRARRRLPGGGLDRLFVALMGGIGYTTQRDLSPLARALLIPFIVVLVFGLIATVRRDPGARTSSTAFRCWRSSPASRHSTSTVWPAPGTSQPGADRSQHLP